MRGESIRTGYGDLGQVGISHLWPPSSKNGVRGDARVLPRGAFPPT